MAEAASRLALEAAVERARTRGPEDVANYAIAVAVSLQCGARFTDVRDNPGGYVKAAKLDALRAQMTSILSEPGMLPADKLHGSHPDRDWYLKQYGQQIGMALRTPAHRSRPEHDVLHSKNRMFASKVSINKKVLPTASEADKAEFAATLRAQIIEGKGKADDKVRGGSPSEQAGVLLEQAQAASVAEMAARLPAAPTGPVRGGGAGPRR